MPNWLIWALLSTVRAIGELTSPGFFFLPTLALGAISAALSGLLGLGLALQLVLFVAVSSASLVLLRPLARRHLRIPSAIRTGSAAVVGKRAIVVARVDAQGGRVKIGRDDWSARAYLAGDVFQPGTHVAPSSITPRFMVGWSACVVLWSRRRGPCRPCRSVRGSRSRLPTARSRAKW